MSANWMAPRDRQGVSRRACQVGEAQIRSRLGALLGAPLVLLAFMLPSVTASGSRTLPGLKPAVHPSLSTNGALPLPIVLDLDDDDEDGVPDATQGRKVPLEDLLPLHLDVPGSKRVLLDVLGGVRILGTAGDGHALPLSTPVHLDPADIRGGRVWVQGTRLSTTPGDAAVVVWSQGKRMVRELTVFRVGFLDANNRRLDASRQALGVSRAVTHDASLPREERDGMLSEGPENVRIEYVGPRSGSRDVSLGVQVQSPTGDVRARHRHLPGHEGPRSEVIRTRFLRIVSGREDLRAPGAPGQIFRARLRDRVRAIALVDGLQYSQDMRIGRPGSDGGSRSALRGMVRVRILRQTPAGPPSIGSNESVALRLAREQISISNEIWSQCFIGFGAPEEADVEIVDPPGALLLSVADEDGLRAAGDGVIHFRVGSAELGPLKTRPGALPFETALAVASRAEEKGLTATVRVNPRTDFGAHGSADIVFRDPSGSPLSIAPIGPQPVSTDSQQRLVVGSVDLRDGLQQFDNARAAAGSLEERTMAAILGDGDPRTLDLFIINRFAEPGRQGEAFIEASGGPMVNTVILDETGVRNAREAWVQSHEIGHVLLDHPLHPDFTGPDRPWLLMDSDARRPGVAGPKRLDADECARVRARSGPDARPALLLPEP